MNLGRMWLPRSGQVRERLSSVPFALKIGTCQMLMSGPESSSNVMNGETCSPKERLTLEKVLLKAGT